MKRKLFYRFLPIIISLPCFSQVGIRTTSPNLTLSIINSDTGIQHNAANKISIVANTKNAITVDQANVGINNLNPTNILDVEANSEFLRISNLKQTTNPTNVLAYPIVQNPTNSEVGYVDASNVYFGAQAMRLVVNEDQNIFGSSYNYHAQALRFKYNPQSGTPAVSGFSNFFNDINGSQFLYNQTLPAGNGTEARTTDQIILPAGVYRITVKLTSNFGGQNKNNSIDLKLSVNNDEYSFANGVSYGDGNSDKTGYFCETVNLNATSKIDFLYVKQTGANDATSVSKVHINSVDNVMRSIILVERLK
jgi:hypothetical protein